MNKAVFLDRDGVINKEIGEYVFSIDKFVLNDDLIPGLKLLQENGFLLIVITNQGGIAKGLYTKDDVEKLHGQLLSHLSDEQITISEIYYCPHHSDVEKCLCRKPNSLMLEKAAARFDIDISQSYMIGDSERDIEAAEKIGIKGIKIQPNASVLPVCKE
ncbi:MAG: HAD family hydrolase, partial [Bacteroidales bacterium]|nr:HAD family hydrolase [Bacteroidales bacterium]